MRMLIACNCLSNTFRVEVLLWPHLCAGARALCLRGSTDSSGAARGLARTVGPCFECLLTIAAPTV